MTLQPCGCGSVEEDWPYDTTDFPPETDNGLKCGDDGGGDTIMWVEPTADVGGFYATKALTGEIANGAFTAITNGATVHFGSAYFDGSDRFTAARAGLYTVGFSAYIDDDDVDEDFEWYLRVTSNYAAWSSPVLKAHDTSITFTGGGITLHGELPCIAGGHLDYDVYHTRTGDGGVCNFKDVIMSALWKCPIPS